MSVPGYGSASRTGLGYGTNPGGQMVISPWDSQTKTGTTEGNYPGANWYQDLLDLIKGQEHSPDLTGYYDMHELANWQSQMMAMMKNINRQYQMPDRSSQSVYQVGY